MADVDTNDIAGYGAYLKAQGVADSEIQGYTKYLSAQHNVDHPSEAEKSWLDKDVMGYTPRGAIQGTLNALPMAGMVAGGFAGAETGPGAIGTAALGAAGGEALKNLGEKYLLGQDKSRAEIYGNPVKGAIEGATAEMGGRIIGKGVEAAADTPVGKYVLDKAGQVVGKIKSFAENAAVNATGATGVQASKFAPNAGRELLDRGLVRFGDSQKKISQRAAEAVEQANKQIDESLSKLQDKGVKVDSNTVYNTVRNTINEMKANPSKADIANNLESELNHLLNATEAKGSNQFGVLEAEQIKRGYNRKAGNWADPEKSQAGKEMYQTWRGAVEDAAQKADPSTAQAFEQAKKSYGLLTPIQEAAERRAATTNQHQAGGFLDITGALAGDAVGGPVVGVMAPIARRIIAPRIGSTVAVTADAAANALSSTGKITGNILNNAPSVVGKGASTLIPDVVRPLSKAAEQEPQKGPSKWANDGYQNLKLHSTDEERALLEKYKDAMMIDPKTKQLLITASNYSPGSKPLEQIMSHLKNRLEKEKQ